MTMIFRVAIVGGRDFTDMTKLTACCDHMLSNKVNLGYRIVIINGTAKGADELGGRYADLRGYTQEKFVPEWDKLGKRAGMVRNTDMAHRADAVIAFWDGTSKGTRNMIQTCQRLGKPIQVYKY
ncbi:hypothetical protein AH6C_039 [Aeromonas phage pAh6-C]|uniref:YspA cpYpsA-related SLOG domain-containing protein n=1 Tax=Aeromonas phage pAh6-C TaxID=1505227 RepID=A0A076G4I8_9CAUD|nr:GTP-binding domain [Aeromonas phage pAh6-C]AII26793.1 hypothetical protein AH6C_039 [Aeromonas phage pAh6-C]